MRQRGLRLIQQRNLSLNAQTNWRGRARFYGQVHVVPSETEQGTFEVELDGRKLRTPSQQIFSLPSRALAGLVAQEWDAQIGVIETSVMPITMQCAMALDVVPTKRPAIEEELIKYLTTDIVCFPQRQLAPEEQEEISGEKEKLWNKQMSRWEKSLEHFRRTYGKLDILDSDTLRAPRHDQAALDAARNRIAPLCDMKLNAVHQLAQGCKSLVIPLALLDRVITVQEAFDAARVEEDHQIDNWGLVEGAHDIDQQNLLTQISSASLLLWLS